MYKHLNLRTENDITLEYYSVSNEEFDSVIEEFRGLSNEMNLVCENYNIIINYLDKNSNVVVAKEDYKDAMMYSCSRLNINYNYYFNSINTEDYMLQTESFTEFAMKLFSLIKEIWNKINIFFKKNWLKVQARYFTLTKEMFELRKKIYGLRDKRPIKLPAKRIKDFIKDYSAYLYFKDVINSLNHFEAMGSIASKSLMYLDEKQINLRMDILKEYSNMLHNIDLNKLKNNEIEDLEEKYDNALENIFSKVYKGSFKFIREDDFTDTDNDIVNFPILASLRPSKSVYGFRIIYLDSKNRIKDSSSINMPDKGKVEDTIHKDIIDIELTTITKLAESIDECKGFINRITNEVFTLDKNINLVHDSLIHTENNFSKRIIKDILVITKTIASDFIMSILDHIKITSKWVDIIYKFARSSSNLGMIEIYEKIKKSPPGKFKLAGCVVDDPSAFKLVQKGKMVYIDPGVDFIKSICKELGHGGITPAMSLMQAIDISEADIFINSLGMNAKNMDNKEKMSHMLDIGSKYRSSWSNDDVIKTSQLSAGIILICEEMLNNPYSMFYNLFNINGDLISFLYYHELGHLSTGQHENIREIEYPDEDDKDKLHNGFIQYTYDPNENKADAYACHALGVTPKFVADERFKFQIKLEGNDLNQHLMSKLKKAKIDMEKNITSKMNEMKEYVDLTPFEIIRNKFLKK